MFPCIAGGNSMAKKCIGILNRAECGGCVAKCAVR